jgi:hypothetical protein
MTVQLTGAEGEESGTLPAFQWTTFDLADQLAGDWQAIRAGA